MTKKLVSFTLADDVKSAVPAGYVESLEQLVNDIMIPRELENLWTQKNRAHADYHKLAHDILGDTMCVVIKMSPYKVLSCDVGSANHLSPGYHTYWRLVADDGTDCFPVQEQHCAAEYVDEELKRFANQNNGRLQWLVKNLLAKQPGYQELCKKIAIAPNVYQMPKSGHVMLSRDDEVKSIYNIKKGATLHSSAGQVIGAIRQEVRNWDETTRRHVEELDADLRALAPLLCDGSIIAGDVSKNYIFVVHPNIRCGDDIVGASYCKYDAYTVLSQNNWFNKYSVHELAKSINDNIEFGRRVGSVSLDYHRYASKLDDVVIAAPKIRSQQNRNEILKRLGITCLATGGLLMSGLVAMKCVQELVAEREKSHKKEIVIDRPDSVLNQQGVEWYNLSNVRHGRGR